MKGNIKVQLLFVNHSQGVAKKTGKEYNILELSNGLKSRSFFLTKDFDVAENLKEGDTLNCEFEVDIMSDSRNIKLISVS